LSDVAKGGDGAKSEAANKNSAVPKAFCPGQEVMGCILPVRRVWDQGTKEEKVGLKGYSAYHVCRLRNGALVAAAKLPIPRSS
jgi:hypothetical protein